MQNLEMRWYAIQVQPGRERMVAALLSHKGYNHFVPYRIDERQKLRGKPALVPLFSGYVFCQFSLDPTQPSVVATPGVVRIVGSGRSPEPVPNREVEGLRIIVNSHTAWTPVHVLHQGCPVEITGGPLVGVQGQLVHLRRRERVVVQINLLGGGASVVADMSVIRKRDADVERESVPLGPLGCNNWVTNETVHVQNLKRIATTAAHP